MQPQDIQELQSKCSACHKHVDPEPQLLQGAHRTDQPGQSHQERRQEGCKQDRAQNVQLCPN